MSTLGKYPSNLPAFSMLSVPRSGRDVSGRAAQIGAIQVDADALGQIPDRLLPEAGVSAGGARLRAGERRVDGARPVRLDQLAVAQRRLIGQRRVERSRVAGDAAGSGGGR